VAEPLVRELDASESHLAFVAMRELRPQFDTLERFVEQVNERQRPMGYRLLASFDGEEVAAAAGFRTGHSLAWGHFLYVDDLVTLSTARRRGHAGRLLDWCTAEARRLGCDQIHLDSGTHRHDAHRLYLQSGYDITGFHFTIPVEGH
jgi:GNAT superfamily N-acetyltransferase